MQSDIEFLIGLNDQKPTEAPPEFISEYIQGKRVLPPGSPMPGPMDVDYTPYFVEIMDAMGPYSGVSVVTVCKGVQIGATANCAENVIAYYMDANPKEILYATATKEGLEKWVKRLEPLIDSCGFRHKIVLQNENTKTRKSADKTYSKEYPGGSLSMSSLHAPSTLRSESKRIVIADEIDAAPLQVSTGEGSPLHILHGRAAGYGARAKFMEYSTPTTFANSVIWKRFEEGDRRYYYVPCPHCDAYQVLEFKQLRPEYQADMLDFVWYECTECKGKIENHHKSEILKRGEWRATALPRTRNHRSYHISGLYSPVGMMSWTAVYQKYLEASEDKGKMPSFTNLYLGMPYKEEGFRPDVRRVISQRGNYPTGEVPKGVLYLTVACDVQRGAEKYQRMSATELDAEIGRIQASGRDPWKSKLPRIELEVMGAGKAYRTWSIDYRVIYGHTTEGAFAGAFERLHEWGETSMVYRRADGLEFRPQIVLIDSSDGITKQAVSQFCDRWPGTYPTVNVDKLKRKQDDGLDEESFRSYDRYRLKMHPHGGMLVTISTVHYKQKLYQSLNVRRNMQDPQPPEFCDFPRDRSDHYFHMLTGEERLENGSFRNGGRPVEALDCRVYAMCAADVWLESEVRKSRDAAKKGGYPLGEVEKIDKKFILDGIQNQVDSYRINV